MKSINKALVYGFGWVKPLVVAIMIFPIRISYRALFESTMPVVVTLCVVLSSHVSGNAVRSSTRVVLDCSGLPLAFDPLMFMPEGPMRMTLADYMKRIGLTDLLDHPTTAVGMSYVAEK